jgi:dsDNA-specific endonuclease/ATPase MutS2
LNQKIQSMEHSLSHVVREFEHEREIIGNLARKELEDVRLVAIKLKKRLEKKTQEMLHIRVLFSTCSKKKRTINKKCTETCPAHFRSKNRFGTILYGRS